MPDERLAMREMLKDKIRKTVDISQTAQSRGEPMPPLQKEIPADSKLIDLPDWKMNVGELQVPLSELITHRKSVRKYAAKPVTLHDLSYLLWATQGVRKKQDSDTVWRNVPSAGNRHALETYIAVRDVTGLEPGIYLYRPLEHALVFVHKPDDYQEQLSKSVYRQLFVSKAPLVFIWAAIPWRMEWRYSEASVKVIALDAGHVCQNLYLAAQSLGLGVCGVAAYDQELIDQFIQVDGKDEFVVYLGSVGHAAP
ncbi:MAG TPA: SagB/ThcOx family dehydrogenase [Fastidiosipila sp.]|jgi:SagB-type dehydrogenase family enzyme|nr:SagB/ThcOx family dehydrogenase [Fastidiosipila sp.]